MYNYILTANRSVIYLDMPWRYRAFQSELNELGITVQLSMTEPGYLKINDVYEIIPVTAINAPPHNELFEHLVGPSYTFFDEHAEANYDKELNDFVSVKNEIKNKIAAERYNREISGVPVTIQNTTVMVDTSRDIRNIFIQKFLLMSDTEVVNWKFNEGWLTLTKSELQTIILAGAQYIQDQFDWEKNQNQLIDNLNSVADLKIFYESIFEQDSRGNSRGSV